MLSVHMRERTVPIPTRDGRMESFVVDPGGGPRPGIVLYMDNPGIRETLRDLTRRIARRGYCVVLPDLYYRRGALRLAMPLSAEDRARIEPARRELVLERFALDAEATLAFLDRDPVVDASRLGTLGLCIGSGYALALVAAFGPRIQAAALIDGCEYSDRAGSRQRFAEGIPTEIYLAFPADADAAFVAVFRRALEAHGISHELELLPDTTHGFPLQDWPGGVYSEAAAAHAWSRTFALFERRLGSGA